MNYKNPVFLLIIVIAVGIACGARDGLGDVNNDGEVNILDVITVVNIILGINDTPTEYQLWAADINSDGAVDILDTVIIVNVILGLVTIDEYPGRILFIGNSYTGYNGGIFTHVSGLVDNAHPSWDMTINGIVQGGATLESHWNNVQTRETISNGNWDIVILQEQSTRPIDNPELMYQYGELLGSLITEAGAETMLFMTWPREWMPETLDDIDDSYTYLGELINAEVVPVGRAWELSNSNDPELDLYAGDDSHPNLYGTYLSSCVFYHFIFDESTAGNLYTNNDNMTNVEQLFLQEIADEIYLEYNPPGE
ncbi:MAG: hypothetical protein HQ510_00200 [Candidatus Marinimicrobia bacterium]|nr:hypothetical protein [Candidatus Neomarinimicrobiota bacterium]